MYVFERIIFFMYIDDKEGKQNNETKMCEIYFVKYNIFCYDWQLVVSLI